jgi:hypothetical protein
MRKKSERSKVAELVRQYGITRAPAVATLVSEVRSDDVPIPPPPPPPYPLRGSCLDGIVIIWTFCLPYGDVELFHDFLRKNEALIEAGLSKSSEKKSAYLGTHLVLSAHDACCTGEATGFCYRVVWRYDSLEAMAATWRSVGEDEKSRLYKTVVRLRAYWLKDPHRGESRSALASSFFDAKGQAGDHFARLTLEAARLKL